MGWLLSFYPISVQNMSSCSQYWRQEHAQEPRILVFNVIFCESASILATERIFILNPPYVRHAGLNLSKPAEHAACCTHMREGERSTYFWQVYSFCSFDAAALLAGTCYMILKVQTFSRHPSIDHTEADSAVIRNLLTWLWKSIHSLWKTFGKLDRTLAGLKGDYLRGILIIWEACWSFRGMLIISEIGLHVMHIH